MYGNISNSYDSHFYKWERSLVASGGIESPSEVSMFSYSWTSSLNFYSDLTIGRGNAMIQKIQKIEKIEEFSQHLRDIME